MIEYKVLLGKKSHIKGDGSFVKLKVNNRKLYFNIIKSSWVGQYHLIFEELEGMTAIRSEHRIVNKEELIQELGGGISLVDDIIKILDGSLDKFHVIPMVKATYKFPNGNVVTFGCNGEQIPSLQGKYTEQLHEKIKMNSNENTIWNGF